MTVPDGDPSKIYTLEGRDVTVVLTAIPHDRCNPRAPSHLTYNKSYRIDFIYRTSSPQKRLAAKHDLFQSAADVGEQLAPFTECPD